jgi:enamine deaminase RidA (YjgF/YER057c/UK114 family)
MSDKEHGVVQPEGWPRPRGYANGVLARGRTLFVAGQIGWNEQEELVSDDFVAQLERALANVVAVVRAAGGAPEHIARMTVYVTDLDAYRSSAKAAGEVWRRVLGRHYPAMALVGVIGLVHPGAHVEIEATAVLPDEERGP